jgi:predicted NACHT family NTPase
VPLGLVERKRQTRRGEDVSPEQGSLLYEETEITQRFEHEQFLEQVLQQEQSPKSRGKRVAIIGEPGAGKTTLLQQIAQWVSEQGEGAIAIWVSLADLRGQELEAYLLERWLQAVARKLGQAEASGQVKDAFVAQFQLGRVWLLLDGVDEMQVSSGNPLSEISRQVRMGGLLSQARIVLSCRLNLWDGERNALDTFDTYRTLEFSYPQQVEQFVGQWFGALPEVQGEQVERLCAALKAPGKERIRDLVKNPLRLTLLCFNWYLGEGTLPETKAGLYEQFVADFYEWKREQFPTTAEQRRQLNAALGELAREAIDKEATRFRLRHDFVCEFLGEPDEPDSLFQLALQWGWLNKVGVQAENPRKAVYAFFHPTFQEYFAAMAIEDWHFFLNHIPENPSHPDANYRIFEPQWKEVILLWLGRDKVQPMIKEALIEALVNFEDGCENFYGFPSYFLAAAGLAEYDYKQTDKILTHLIKLGFGDLELGWGLKILETPVTKSARLALTETNRNKLTSLLTRIIQTNSNEKILINAAMISRETKTNNRNEALQVLRNLKKSQDISTSFYASVELSNFEQELQKFNETNKIYKKEQELPLLKDEQIVGYITITDYLNYLKDIIREITLSNLEIINLAEELSKILDSGLNDFNRAAIARVIGEVGSGNHDVYSALVRLILTSSSSDILRTATFSMIEILDKYFSRLVVSDLRECLYNQDEEKEFSFLRRLYSFEVIWQAARQMSYPDFHKAWNAQPITTSHL